MLIIIFRSQGAKLKKLTSLSEAKIKKFSFVNSAVPDFKNLSETRELLKERKHTFKLDSNFNSEEFRMVAIGFFQAEGHISYRIKGKYFYPVFVINQNLTLWPFWF